MSTWQGRFLEELNIICVYLYIDIRIFFLMSTPRYDSLPAGLNELQVRESPQTSAAGLSRIQIPQKPPPGIQLWHTRDRTQETAF